MLSEELEYTRKPDGGLSEQIEVLEAFADGDADNTELLMLLIELRSLREQLAAINGAQEPVGFVKCDPCAEDCRWDCVDPIYLAGSVTPEGYGSDYFEVYRHPAPLKE
ncbi:TPA: hypothetical protein PXJ57_003819 [Yersinia enterocolitica]|nr:hypothetical protein [Yersinia enterocolitica]